MKCISEAQCEMYICGGNVRCISEAQREISYEAQRDMYI